MATSTIDEVSASDLAGQLADLKRAIPLSRMIDYGLAAADATFLHDLANGGAAEWIASADRLAQVHLAAARRLVAVGKVAMARLEKERAAAAWNIGQLALNRDDDDKRRLYALASDCLVANARDSDCEYRRVELALEGGQCLYGWDFQVPDPIGSVVMFGGLNGWGASFLGLARRLAGRSIRTILAEAPGQGETRLTSGLYLSRAALGQAMRFIALAAEGGGPVGLVGFSYGGLIAAHLAAAAPDVAALCTNGSPVAIGELVHPAEQALFGAAFGAEGAELRQLVGEFNFDAADERVGCPVLALEGGMDPLVPLDTWRGFVGEGHRAVDAFAWADGLHTLYNHAGERDALIAAWLSDCFCQSARESDAGI